MKLPAYEVIPLASWFCVNEWQDIWCCFSTVFSEHIVFYRQHCAQRKPAGIKFTQRPILRFFAPQGRHVASIGVKFGMEEGTKGPLLHAKFHPHRCNDKGVGPPKFKFLLRFDRNVKYKRPCGAFIFHISVKSE